MISNAGRSVGIIRYITKAKWNPRLPGIITLGNILAFDELNQKTWPGETLALLEEFGIRNLKIERFSYAPSISFAVL